MKTIIAGTRTFTDKWLFAQGMLEAKSRRIEPTVIISGTAAGADTLGEQWAKHWGIELIRVPAEWEKYGKRAGYMRNSQMADQADALIAFWDGKSRGTKHMIDIAMARKLKTSVSRYDLFLKTDELNKKALLSALSALK